MAFNFLVVDDSRITRTMIIKTLQISGIEVGELYEAENGKQGLSRLQEEWVDIILTDINMPEMNGLEMIDIITKDDVWKNIPIVVISTDGSQTRIDELISKGVRAYLRKPFTPETIRDLVQQILGDGNEN